MTFVRSIVQPDLATSENRISPVSAASPVAITGHPSTPLSLSYPRHLGSGKEKRKGRAWSEMVRVARIVGNRVASPAYCSNIARAWPLRPRLLLQAIAQCQPCLEDARQTWSVFVTLSCLSRTVDYSHTLTYLFMSFIHNHTCQPVLILRSTH